MFSYNSNYLINFVNKLFRLENEHIRLSVASDSELLKNEKINKIKKEIKELSEQYEKDKSEENLKKLEALNEKLRKLKEKIYGNTILMSSFKFLDTNKGLNLSDPELRGLSELIKSESFEDILSYYDFAEDKQSFSNVIDAFKNSLSKIQKYQIKSFNKIVVVRPTKIDPKTKKEVSDFQEFRKRVMTVYKSDFIKILKAYLKGTDVDDLGFNKEEQQEQKKYAEKCYEIFDINELKDKKEEQKRLVSTISELQTIYKSFQNVKISTVQELLTQLIKLLTALKQFDYHEEFLKSFVKKADIKLTKALKQKILNCVEKSVEPTFENDLITDKDSKEEKERKKALTNVLVSKITDEKITTIYKSEYQYLASHVEVKKKQTYVKIGTLSDNEKITTDEKAILGVRLINEIFKRTMKLKSETGKKQLNITLIM